MPLPAAILFDLDDTLIAFDAVATPAWREVVQRHAPRVGIADAQLLQAIQAGNDLYWSDPERHRAGRQNLPATRRMLVHQALTSLGCDDAPRAHAIADDYTRLRSELIHLLPGALAVLEAVRGHSIRMALVTNGTADEQRAKVERFQLAPYFEFIQIEGELGIGKPEDGAYAHALARLALPPSEVWFVGDNLEWDVRAPQRHGMTGVWVDRRRNGHAEGPAPQHSLTETRGLVDLLARSARR